MVEHWVVLAAMGVMYLVIGSWFPYTFARHFYKNYKKAKSETGNRMTWWDTLVATPLVILFVALFWPLVLIDLENKRNQR